MTTYEQFREVRCRKWLVHLVQKKQHFQKQADWWREQVRHSQWNIDNVTNLKKEEREHYEWVANTLGPAMIRLNEEWIGGEFRLYNEYKNCAEGTVLGAKNGNKSDGG